MSMVDASTLQASAHAAWNACINCISVLDHKKKVLHQKAQKKMLDQKKEIAFEC